MMIVRGDDPALDMGDVVPISQLNYSDTGGLTQFGAYVETLKPGEITSHRHWHENQDEFLYMLSGEATVVEEDGEHVIRRGDAACWSAGVENAHHVVNRSDSPCSYLIFGTRMATDAVHYPESGVVLRDEDDRFELRNADGELMESGEIGQVRPLAWAKGHGPKRG